MSSLGIVRFIWAHIFGDFSPWSLGPVAFGPVRRQHLMAGARGWANPVHLLVARKWKKEEVGDSLPVSSTRACPWWPNFLPQGSTSQRLCHSPQCHPGDQAFPVGLWGTLKIQTTAHSLHANAMYLIIPYCYDGERKEVDSGEISPSILERPQVEISRKELFSTESRITGTRGQVAEEAAKWEYTLK